MIFALVQKQGHTKSVVPIMLDWFDGSSSQLSVTFDGCDFHVSATRSM